MREKMNKTANKNRGWRPSPFLLIFGTCCIIGLCVSAAHLIPPYFAYCKYSPQEGDVIFQSLPGGKLTITIEGVSQSPYLIVVLLGKIQSQGNGLFMKPMLALKLHL